MGTYLKIKLIGGGLIKGDSQSMEGVTCYFM